MTKILRVNGKDYEVDPNEYAADVTLVNTLRRLELTATKYMCLEGGCGACVCAITEKNPVTGQVETKAANSCLTLLNTCLDGSREITTCEGIGNKVKGYHPIQTRVAEKNATQCGFCTPGFVMNMWSLLESKNGAVSTEEVERAFDGNICRCTGYRPILECMKSFATNEEVKTEECADIEDFEWVTMKTCPKTGQKCTSKDGGSCKYSQLEQVQYPNGRRWFFPRNLTELFTALNTVGSNKYMLVAGNTAHGVYRRDPGILDFIQVGKIPELRQSSLNSILRLGANITLTEAIDLFERYKTTAGFEYLSQLVWHFKRVANVPVRNMGTLAGNIITKKERPEFPSDIFICFEALDVTVVVSTSATVEERMPLTKFLFTTQRKMVIKAFELKPYDKNSYVFKSYKVARRAKNAHAILNAAFLLQMNRQTGDVTSARICYGNVRPGFAHVTKVESYLIGKNLYDAQTLANIMQQLAANINPLAVIPEPSPEYRRILAIALFYKFVLNTAPADKIKPEYRKGGDLLVRPISSGTQTFTTDPSIYPVTQPVEKVEGLIQATGEAIYLNDIPIAKNAVYCAFAKANRVGATIERIYASEALKVPGVIAFYTAADIPGKNTFVSEPFGYEPDELLCSGLVRYYDQPCGIIVAETQEIAYEAVQRVQLLYATNYTQQMPQLMLTASDVLEHKANERINSMVESNMSLSELHISAEEGNLSASGIFQLGGQYHFCLEPLSAVAVPFEQGLHLYCSTQWMDHTQLEVAEMLKTDVNKVLLEVRRLGGAYGLKISGCNKVAGATAMVAYLLQRQTRFVQNIESMMTTVGKRWACRSDYKFTVAPSGKIQFLENIFYEDGGINLNESPVVFYTTPVIRNCYQLDETNFKFTGNAVTTDAPSNVWFRGPGSLEGIAMMENIIEHIAFTTGKDPADVRLANIRPGNKMQELLPRFLESNEYRVRRREIDDYNATSRWHKRGMGIACSEFVIEYLGQYGATVALYHGDGSCVIKHGGIEMGQGLNTKISQVAAYILGIPLSKVKVETSDTINGSASFVSGGSISSESVAKAVQKACDTLKQRLQPIRDELGANGTFEAALKIAYVRNINLIASDHCKAGDLIDYKIYGLAMCELELDVLTGTCIIRKVDILQDTGNSLSPNTDIGQIEGAFTIGLGYWLSEKLIYDRTTGRLATNRTWEYKVPGSEDIPVRWNITLLPGNPNPYGFMRSKSTGEPPICLAICAVFALQHAVQSVLADNGVTRRYIPFGAPTTPEEVSLAMGLQEGMFKLK